MEQYLKASGRNLAFFQVNVSSLMARFTTDSGMKVNLKDSVWKFGQMDVVMKVTGSKGNLLEKVLKLIKMDKLNVEDGKAVCS